MSAPGIAIAGTLVPGGSQAAPAGAQGIPGTSATIPASSLGVFIESPSDKTYVLDLDAPSPYTITKLSIETVSGTCTAALNRNGAAITGATAISVTSTLSTVTLSRAVAEGDTIALVISANSSAVDLSDSVWVQP